MLKISSLNDQVSFNNLKVNQKSYYKLHNSVSMESQPETSEFRNHSKNIHQCFFPSLDL